MASSNDKKCFERWNLAGGTHSNVAKAAVQPPPIIKQFFTQNEDLWKTVDVKTAIVLTREKFEVTLIKLKGPVFYPTIFKNHPLRYTYVREREKRLQHIRNPKNPPDEPFFLSTFANDVVLNILLNLNDKNKAYISHTKQAKVVCLNRQSCAEDAFDEMLTHKPYFYFDDMSKVELSNYADCDRKNWTVTHPDQCNNFIQFVVEFSIILPEFKVSSAYIMCYECGKFVETIFCAAGLKFAKKEIFHNIDRMVINEQTAEKERHVIRLPLRNFLIEGISFVEGLIGVTPLTQANPASPALFVRTRLSIFCKSKTPVSSAVHSSGSQDVFPDLTAMLEKFHIH